MIADRSIPIGSPVGSLFMLAFAWSVAWSAAWSFMVRTFEKNMIPRISVTTAWNISTAFPHLMLVIVSRSL